MKEKTPTPVREVVNWSLDVIPWEMSETDWISIDWTDIPPAEIDWRPISWDPL